MVVAACSVAHAHPGQHIDLQIAIDPEAVAYRLTLSHDLAVLLLPAGLPAATANAETQAYQLPDPAEAERLLAAADELLGDINPVTIDGLYVIPIIQAAELVPPLDLQGEPDPQSDKPDLRVTVVYPAKCMPRTVSMVWDLFPEDPSLFIKGLDTATKVMAELDAAGQNTIVVFTPQEPEVIWHAPAQETGGLQVPSLAPPPRGPSLPVLSLALILAWAALLLVPAARRNRLTWIGGIPVLAVGFLCYGVLAIPLPGRTAVPLPADSEAREIFAALHANIYRAFDYKEAEDVYDVLAQSVGSELIDELYNQIYEGLIMRDQGGAVARVHGVDLLTAEIGDAGIVADTGEAAFTVDSRWRVHGVVYHWGHVHERTNEHAALYTVAQQGKTWRITGVKVLEQRRVLEDEAPSNPASEGT